MMDRGILAVYKNGLPGAVSFSFFVVATET